MIFDDLGDKVKLDIKRLRFFLILFNQSFIFPNLEKKNHKILCLRFTHTFITSGEKIIFKTGRGGNDFLENLHKI